MSRAHLNRVAIVRAQREAAAAAAAAAMAAGGAGEGGGDGLVETGGVGDSGPGGPLQSGVEEEALMPLHGIAETGNLHPVILQRVQESRYMRTVCVELDTFDAVLDEVYNEVTHAGPWFGTGGQQKAPSTAFCLLYRLLSMRVTEDQLNTMLSHTDSPYIRALGFLYLRYAGVPQELWEWFRPYIDDPEELCPSADQGRTTTVGQFCRRLLTGALQYYDTMLPRIPVPVLKQIEEKLRVHDAGGTSAAGSTADEVAATTASASSSAATTVAAEAPASAPGGARKWGGKRNRARDKERLDRKRAERERELGRDRDDGQDRRGRGWGRGDDDDTRGYDRSRGPPPRGARSVSRSRSRDRDQYRDRGRDRDLDRGRDRDGYDRYDRRADYAARDSTYDKYGTGDRGRGSGADRYDRYRDERRYRGRSRSRSRSRSRDRERGWSRNRDVDRRRHWR